MRCEEIMEREDFRKCVEFHGHFCPGLAIGYRAAAEVLRYLKEQKSIDEELVAIVENDACGVDAVQALTGCTFGKGNLIHRDYGKQVFYFISRGNVKAIRISMRDKVFETTEKHKELAEMVRNGRAGKGALEKFQLLNLEKACAFLETPFDEMFRVEEMDIDAPEKARVRDSEPCDRCGEPTMITKLNKRGGEKVCGECLAKEDRKVT